MLADDAAKQAQRDANAKIQIDSGKATSAFRWLLGQNLKIQFVVVAALLFLTYGVFQALLSITGLRHSGEPGAAAPAVPKCENPALTVKERALCVVETDGPPVIHRPGTAAQAEAAKEAQRQTQLAAGKGLNDEVSRLRQAARFKALREEFERRMTEIGKDVLAASTGKERQAYYHDTLVVMTEMLQLSEHPMKASHQRIPPGRSFPSEYSQAVPPGGEDVERRVQSICGQLPRTRARLSACSAALRDNVFSLRFGVSSGLLMQAVLSPAQGD